MSFQVRRFRVSYDKRSCDKKVDSLESGNECLLSDWVLLNEEFNGSCK